MDTGPFRSVVVGCLLVAVMQGVGCDAKPRAKGNSASSRQSADAGWAKLKSTLEADHVGRWECRHGGESGFYVLRTLDLRADKTVLYRTEMPDRASSEAIVHELAGAWEAEVAPGHRRLVVTLQASRDGQPIPDDRKVMKLEMWTEAAPGGGIRQGLGPDMNKEPKFYRKSNQVVPPANTIRRPSGRP